MDKQEQRYSKGLFNVLFTGTVGICLLTVATFFAFFLLRYGKTSYRFLERNVAEYVQAGTGAFGRLLNRYQHVTESLSEDQTLLRELKETDDWESSELYRRLYETIDDAMISPVIHILSADTANSLSTGSKTQEFRLSDYASAKMILETNHGTLLHAARFLNTSGQTVVLVFGHELVLDGNLLGYIFLDLTENEIKTMFSDDPAMQINGPESYANYIVYNWYDYIIYNKSNLSGIHLGTNYLKRAFADTFRMDQPTAISYQSNGSEYLLSGMQDESESFAVLCAVSMGLLQKNNRQIVIAILCISAGMLLVCFLFALKINNSIIGPIKNILATMQRVRQGDLSAQCRFESNNELALLRDQLNQTITDVDRAFRDNEEKQQLLLLAEDNVLKAQIKPHFLNNVLESIHWMVKMGEGDSACIALRSLGKMMTERMNSYYASHETLGDSLEFTKHYLQIQKLCYPEKLDIELDFSEESLQYTVPTFLLQPIVENAVIHGLQPKVGSGTLCIRSRVESDGLHIMVRDDGVGMDKDLQCKLLRPREKGHGIGLYNVHRRLQLCYGEDCGLQIESEPDHGTCVRIRIPAEKNAD